MELIGTIKAKGALTGSFDFDQADYNLLKNKPSINGVELVGNKTSEDLHIETGGGGTDDYNDLINKPMINGIGLIDNKTANDLGLQEELSFPQDPTKYLDGEGNFTTPPTVGSYNDLTDKPQINGVTLTGNKTTADLGIDYDDLTSRPEINGHVLTGDQSSSDLGLEPAITYPEDSNYYLNGDGEFTIPPDTITTVEVTPTATAGAEVGRISVNGLEKVLYNGLITYGTASGNPATFPDGAAGEPVECSCDIEPIQAGSGTPSINNPRPITASTEANITVSPTSNPAEGTTETILFGQSVYGGKLNVKTGELTVEKAFITYDGTEDWADQTAYRFYLPSLPVNLTTDYAQKFNSISNIFIYRDSGSTYGNGFAFGSAGIWVNKEAMGDTLEDFKTMLSNTNMQVCYPVNTPTTVQLTPTEINILLGQNYIWSDTGDIEVKYIRDINAALQYIFNQI